MKHVYIIAEAGVNHNGSLILAKQLVDVAVAAGADAVKFQTFKTTNLVSKKAEKADYQKKATGVDESQFEMIKKLELSEGMHLELLAYCQAKNIEFLSTPFDHDSIELLNNLGLKTFKIPSGEIVNLPYLRHIGRLNKQVILSTGMASLGEVEAAIDVLVAAGTDRANISVLHANTEYPTPMCDVNLRAMQTLGQAFNLPYGYSDHTEGIEVPIAAVALGATIIEKHFTLDKTMEGPDHRASIEPQELGDMVRSIRNIESALGSFVKQTSPSEAKNKLVARKSIVAKAAIKQGDILNEFNIAVKRPGTGISPMRWDEVIGTVAKKDYSADDLII